jgi:hypothetical protein
VVLPAGPLGFGLKANQGRPGATIIGAHKSQHIAPELASRIPDGTEVLSVNGTAVNGMAFREISEIMRQSASRARILQVRAPRRADAPAGNGAANRVPSATAARAALAAVPYYPPSPAPSVHSTASNGQLVQYNPNNWGAETGV